MDLPRACPQCKLITQINMRWIQRTNASLYLGDDSAMRDQLFECSACNVIFRARYELTSFNMLIEEEKEATD